MAIQTVQKRIMKCQNVQGAEKLWNGTVVGIEAITINAASVENGMDLPVNEIEFSSDTAHRKQWFRGLSFSHPAKMHLSLQMYLIEHYTKPGDTILDPMTGSGTILVACAIGRNVICVELEQKFVDMQQANWQKIKALGPILGYKMGEAVILQGDARNLEGLLADKVVFSPPFSKQMQDVKWMQKNQPGKYRGTHDEKSQSPNNISNLPYGEVSAVISSPPYEASITGKELPESEKLIERKSGKEKWGKHLRLGRSQLTKYADVICTSPPYEEGLGHKDTRPTSQGMPRPHYTENPQAENIGNLKSENYLQAMLQVYQQCHRVLREGGLMILVTKNFIRNKQVIRLDTDTIKLCETAGFTLKERLKRKLTQQSFWRIIYQRKYPDAPKIEFEDILVFEKADQPTES